MPNFADAFPQNYGVTHNPLDTLSMDPMQFINGVETPFGGTAANPIGSMLSLAITGFNSEINFLNMVIQEVIPGAPTVPDITQLVQLLENCFAPAGLLTNFLGGIPFANLLFGGLSGTGPGSGTGLFGQSALFNPGGLFSGLTSGIPLLSQLIGAAGGNTGAANLLTEFVSIFTGGGGAGIDFNQLIGMFANAFPGLTGLTGLTSIFTDIVHLLGNPTALGSGAPGIPAVTGIPLLGGLFGTAGLLGGFTGGSTILSQLIGLFPGTAGGLTGLGGLGSIFTDIARLLGTPSGLGGGSPTLPGISSIPLLGGLLGTSGMLGGFSTASPIVGQLAQMLGLSSTSTLTQLITAGTSMLSMLGSPNLLPSGSFDPIAAGTHMLQTVLTPAGALTSLTQIPIHLFGNLTSTAGSNSNLLASADPGFSNASSLAGQGLWTWDGTQDHTGVTGSGSAKTTANGTQIGLMSVPISATPNQTVTLSAWFRWTGMSAAAGAAISLIGVAYDANDNSLNGSGTVVASVTAPGTASSTYSGHDANGWVNLMSGFQAPASTAYVRLAVQVGSNAVAGSVWVDDLSMSIAGFIDATALFNFENMAQGVIPGGALQGFQGLVDMFASFSHLMDGLGTASSLTAQVGLDFSQLFGFIQDLAIQADQGGSQGTINTNILGFRQNKPVGHGMHPTSESMFPLTSFGTGGAMTTTSLTAGNAIGQPFRPAEVATKGFVEFIASGTSVTNILVNIYSVVPSTGAKTKLWGSTDQSTLITTTLAPVKVSIPTGSQPTVNAGQSLLIEIVNNGTNALTVVTKNTGQPNHPTDFPYNIGTTRVLASTGGAQPTSLTDAQVTHTSNTPYINFGIQAIPGTYVPPQVSEFGASGTWTRPGGFVDGDLVDVFILGGGGGGQSGGYGIPGYGGQAGQWRLQTFVIGSDPNSTGYPILPNTTTTLAIGIGGGGAGGINPYTLDPGHPGGSSTVSGTGVTTLTGGGGAGGANGWSGSGQSGQGAGNQTIGAYTAYGGPTVGVNGGAGQPGGGGASGYPAFGSAGGTGHVWIRTKQASSQ